jgi:tetratricopeptide (TPR) repeat protein
MNCERAKALMTDDRDLLGRASLRLHLLGCRSCRAEAGHTRALEVALDALPRFEPPGSLLPDVLAQTTRGHATASPQKENVTVKRVAYAATFLIVAGLVVGGIFWPFQERGAGDILVRAAYAMAQTNGLHVRGESSLADEYHPWRLAEGSFERWYSPEGFRFDFHDAEGDLIRAVGGVTATGQAWQFYPGRSGWHMAQIARQSDEGSGGGIGGASHPETEPSGAILLYDVGPDRLADFAKLSRERFANGDLRLASIEERNHEWQEYAAEWQGRSVTVIEEDLGSDLVSGDPRGHVEYYLDPATDRFIGLRQFGPESDGHPLQASVDLVEYDIEIPASTFIPEAPADAQVLEGQYYVRPSGDILFRPGTDSRVASLSGAAYEDLHYAGMGALPWEEVEASYLLVLEEDPDDYTAREYLGRMYTRWGLHEEALAILPAAERGWSALNRAFCYDALGEREKALELYEKMKDYGHDSIAQWARLGLEHPTWPRDLDVGAEPGERVLSPGASWTASAFNSSHPFTPDAAIDGDRAQRWGSGGDPSNDGQAPGNWFELDFGKPTRVTRIVLDHYGIYVIVNDWPRGIRASYTSDGESWEEVDVSPAGPVQPATAHFDSPTSVRTIRFETTTYHTPEWWSIHEIYVFSPAG